MINPCYRPLQYYDRYSSTIRSQGNGGFLKPQGMMRILPTTITTELSYQLRAEALLELPTNGCNTKYNKESLEEGVVVLIRLTVIITRNFELALEVIVGTSAPY